MSTSGRASEAIAETTDEFPRISRERGIREEIVAQAAQYTTHNTTIERFFHFKKPGIQLFEMPKF
jgi:hypothetical protein